VSRTAEMEEVYSALEESARLLDVPCSRDKVWPILTAFGGALAEGLIVFSVQTGERHAGELDCSFKVPPEFGDPYPYALANGFVAETDHPVGALLSDIHAQISVKEYGIDCGVVGGFKKFYAHFPGDLQRVSKLADIPAMPRAVAENATLFARYGLDEVAMIGVDYKHKTMNLYFQFAADGRPEPSTILSMLREIGLHEPNEGMLEFAHKSMRANITLSWDSSKILRAAFAPPPGPELDPSAVPARIEPHIERFVTSAPRAYSGERMSLFGVKWFPDGEFIDVCSYYRIPADYEPLRFMATQNKQVSSLRQGPSPETSP
jgi:Aromatic prenyltransferase Orf2